MADMPKALLSTPTFNLPEDLLECLYHLEPADSSKAFALFDTQKNPPNPGLCLKNGGLIGLPLSDGDAEVFRTASHPLPLNKDPEAFVGQTTWVLPAGGFEIQNPAWEPFLRDLVTKVSAGLGVDSTGKGVSAELLNLSLYNEGPLSMPGRECGKRPSNPRMFGTLAITLPSRYEGGDVCISRGGRQVFATSQSSAFDILYIAWFHDVTREVRPVLAGRRLVLTYNLVHSTLGPDVLAAGSNKSVAKLDLLFSYWKENVEEETSLLAYLLNDELDDDKLSYNGLEGQDLRTVTHLRQASEKYDFCIYLASLKRSIQLNDEDDDDRFHEREIDQSGAKSTLERVVELDGTELAKGMYFEDEILIQEEPFEGVEPDDEESSDTTGSSVVYQRTVVLIMPKTYRISWFFTPSFPRAVGNSWNWTTEKGTTYTPDVTGWVDRLSGSYLNQSGDSDDRKDLVEICTLVLDSIRGWKRKEAHGVPEKQNPPPFSSADIARVVAACVDLDNKDLFLEAFELCPYKVPASTFKLVGAALLRYQLQSLLPKLSLHISVFSELADRFDIINEVQQGVTEESRRSGHIDVTYQEWVVAEADKVISDPTVTITSASDGTILANYCKTLPRSDIFQKVLPAVERNIRFTPMTLAFQLAIFTAGTESPLLLETARTVFAHVISQILNGFSLLALGGSALLSPPSLGVAEYSRPIRPPLLAFDADRSREIALLLCDCDMLQLSTELNFLLSSLAEEARTITVDWFEITFLPFLKTLGSIIQELNLPTQHSPFQSLFQQVLSTYVERYVRPEPQPSKDWSRPIVLCDCQDCPSLNLFLANPKQQVANFRVAGKRRDHIYSKVSDTGIDQRTDRTSSVPYTLVLTKNTKCFEIAHKAWEERCIGAGDYLQIMDSEVGLKPFLADLYTPIVSLSMVSSSAARDYRQLLPPPLASGGSHMQGLNVPQPLALVANNIQGARQLLALPSISAEWWRSMAQSGSHSTTGGHQKHLQGTKRKASEVLEHDPKRPASEVIVIDE